MEESERDKLVKVLRMFGSNHDGEVASAARRAHDIVKKHSLDWDDLVLPVTASRAQRQQSRPHPEPDGPDEAFLIRRALQFAQYVSSWEREFLNSISESLIEWGRLTPKQRAVLDRINNKLQLRGCW